MEAPKTYLKQESCVVSLHTDTLEEVKMILSHNKCRGEDTPLKMWVF